MLFLKFNIALLPTFIFVGLLITLGVLYSFFVMEGRWAGYLPPISEVVTGIYNTKFFSPAITVLTFLLIILLYLIIIWGEIWSTFPNWFVRFGQTLMFLIPICFLGVAGVTIETQFETHLAFLFTGYFLLFLFNAFVVFILWREMNVCLKIIRLFFFLTSLISYCCMFIGPATFITLSAAFEFGFLFSLSILMLSWTIELRSVDAEFYVDNS